MIVKMEDVENLLERINQDAKHMLSETRYMHSVGVMKKAIELAHKYHIDKNKAKLVGLAHDIAKEMSKEEMLSYIKQNHIRIDQYEAENLGLLHGKIGAHFCKEQYGFTEDMQKAIEYHTVGNAQMDDLAKIIFIADKTEEGRKYIDFVKVAEQEEQGLDNLLLYILDNSIIHVIETGKIMHPDTIFTRNNFLLCKKH